MYDAIFSASALTALLQVIMIDVVLAGDNAVVIGLAAAGLPKEQRAKVIFIGIAAATVLRIGLSLIATQLFAVVGLLLAGGILLLWVSWKMWRELRHHHATGDGADPHRPPPQQKTLMQAVWLIIAADFSMSLDNVLAVGGAAREHPWVLVFGLALSIGLMGLAASWISSLLQKHRWIAYVGLAIITYVALEMIWRGWHQVQPALASLAFANGVNPVLLAVAAVVLVALISAGALGLKRRERVRN
jgi:YjbE family integral membrane protein